MSRLLQHLLGHRLVLRRHHHELLRGRLDKHFLLLPFEGGGHDLPALGGLFYQDSLRDRLVLGRNDLDRLVLLMLEDGLRDRVVGRRNEDPGVALAGLGVRGQQVFARARGRRQGQHEGGGERCCAVGHSLHRGSLLLGSRSSAGTVELTLEPGRLGFGGDPEFRVEGLWTFVVRKPWTAGLGKSHRIPCRGAVGGRHYPT